MSHMIDMTNERANIAYEGDVPWHGLGVALQPGQSIADWRAAAGLSHSVLSAPVEYRPSRDCVIYRDIDGEIPHKMWADRKVLYRSDTGTPLSVVGHDYRIVQPAAVMDFFSELCANNHFTMDCAGSLDGGKRIWALARVNDGAPVIGQDVVRPYVLLATSYDTSMSTVAKFTSVRVVCHNTLTMSAGYNRGDGQSGGQTERDQTDGPVVSCVRVPHTEDFDPKAARLDLGIVLDAYDRFMVEARLLAGVQVDERFADGFLRALLPTPISRIKQADGSVKKEERPVEETRSYKAIMALFKGEAIGSGLPGAGGTAWGLLNAVTQHVDHQRGRSDNSRMSSAWFGEGEGLKNKALNLLTSELA